MALTQVPPALLTSTTGTGTTVVLSASPTFTGTVTTPSVTFSDGSTQTAAASPYVLKNRIINGDMVIDQRNAGASVSNANGFITDRWSLSKYDPTGGSYSGQQVSDAPTGFKNSLKVTVTSSITQSADQYWQAFQTIEGYNVADLGFGTSSPSQVTVSFWVKSSVTGTYSISLYNHGVGGGARAYVTTYTINAANTWEYKTVTITGDGASGAGYWGTTNGGGIGVYFDLGCGTNQQATANTWTATNARRVSGTVRLMNTSSATWQITGVQLEIGTSATPFERRLYNQELANCQRYCVKYDAGGTYQRYGVGLNYSTTQNSSVLYLPVEMRVQPTLTTTGTASNYAINHGSDSVTACNAVPTLAPAGSNTKIINLNATVASGLTAGGFGNLLSNANTSSYLLITAEL